MYRKCIKYTTSEIRKTCLGLLTKGGKCGLFFFSTLHHVACVFCGGSSGIFQCLSCWRKNGGEKPHFGKIQWNLSSMKQVGAGRENVKASQTTFECSAWNFWWWQMCVGWINSWCRSFCLHYSIHKSGKPQIRDHEVLSKVFGVSWKTFLFHLD